jgi:hypothetical protein
MSSDVAERPPPETEASFIQERFLGFVLRMTTSPRLAQCLLVYHFFPNLAKSSALCYKEKDPFVCF